VKLPATLGVKGGCAGTGEDWAGVGFGLAGEKVKLPTITGAALDCGCGCGCDWTGTTGAADGRAGVRVKPPTTKGELVTAEFSLLGAGGSAGVAGAGFGEVVDGSAGAAREVSIGEAGFPVFEAG